MQMQYTQGLGDLGTGQDHAAAAAAAIAAVQARQEEEDQSATAACKEQALKRAETIRFAFERLRSEHRLQWSCDSYQAHVVYSCAD